MGTIHPRVFKNNNKRIYMPPYDMIVTSADLHARSARTIVTNNATMGAVVPSQTVTDLRLIKYLSLSLPAAPTLLGHDTSWLIHSNATNLRK